MVGADAEAKEEDSLPGRKLACWLLPWPAFLYSQALPRGGPPTVAGTLHIHQACPGQSGGIFSVDRLPPDDTCGKWTKRCNHDTHT